MAGVSSPRSAPRFLPPRTSRTVTGLPPDKTSAVDKRTSLIGERDSDVEDGHVRARNGTLTQKDLENSPNLASAKKLLEKKYSDNAFTSGAYKKQRTQKTGWLMAQKVFTGGSRVAKKKWSLYWCVIRNATISYYKDRRETRLKGLMSLRDVKVLDVTRHVLPPPAKRIEQTECTKCNSKFGLMKKRFSCKNCGSFFCEHCSTKKLPLLRYGRVLPARVCDSCYTKVFAELTASEVARCCYDETRKVWRLEENKFSLPVDQRQFLFGLKNAEGEVWMHAETNMEASAWLDMLDRVQDNLQKEKLGAQSQWEIDFDELTIIKKVGAGAYGEVYSARLWGTLVAVKRLNVAKFPDQAKLLADLQSEAQILSQLRHPNVVLYVGAATKQSNVCIVTEWCAMGSLHDVLHDHSISLSARKMATLAMGVAQGMNYLHNLPDKIIHRDLKSHNVLIDKDWNVKVADFGLSRVRKKAGEGKRVQRATQQAQGTPEWMAPEIMAPTPGKAETEKIDIYSFGVLLCEILTRALPFRDQYHIETFDDVVDIVLDDGALPTIPSWAEHFLKPLILQCLSRDPEKRPSFSDIISTLSDLLSLDEEQYLHRFDLPRVTVLLSSIQPVDQALGAREFYAMMVADTQSNLVLAQDEGNYLLHFNKLMDSSVMAVQMNSVKAMFALLKASKNRLVGNVKALIERGALTRLVQLWQTDNYDLTKEVSPLLILLVTTQPTVLQALDGSGLAVVEFVLGAHIRQESEELLRLTQLLQTKKDVFALTVRLRSSGKSNFLQTIGPEPPLTEERESSVNSQGSHLREDDNEEREDSTGSHQKENEGDEEDDDDEMVLELTDEEDEQTPNASDVPSETDDFLTLSPAMPLPRASFQLQRKQELLARNSEMYVKKNSSNSNINSSSSNFSNTGVPTNCQSSSSFSSSPTHHSERLQETNAATNNKHNDEENPLLYAAKKLSPLKFDETEEDLYIKNNDQANDSKNEHPLHNALSRFSLSTNAGELESSVLFRDNSLASESSFDLRREVSGLPREDSFLKERSLLTKRPPDPPLIPLVNSKADLSHGSDNNNSNSNNNSNHSQHAHAPPPPPPTPTHMTRKPSIDDVELLRKASPSFSHRPRLSTKHRISQTKTSHVIREHVTARLSENSLATSDLSQRLALLSKRHELHVQRAKPRFEHDPKCRPSNVHAMPIPAVALDPQLVSFLHDSANIPEMKVQGNAIYNDFAVLFDAQVRSWLLVCLVFIPSALLVFPADVRDPSNALSPGAKPLLRIKTSNNDDSSHKEDAAERATIGGDADVRERSSSIPSLVESRDRSFSMSNLAAATRRLRHTRSANLQVWAGVLTSFVAAKEEPSHCLIVDNGTQTWCFGFANDQTAKKWRRIATG